MLISLPVLQHLRVDTRTFLEQSRKNSDVINCSEIRGPGGGGVLSRLMISRLNHVQKFPKPHSGAKEDEQDQLF